MLNASRLTCPVCGRCMRLQMVGHVVVERCGSCEGVWLDAGEMDSYLSELGQGALKVPARTGSTESPAQLSPKTCPGCRLPMIRFNFAYDSGVLLDRCERCGGIWVDQGEATRAAEHLRGSAAMNRAARAWSEELASQRSAAAYFDFWQSLSARASLASFLVPKLILPLGDVNARSIVPAVTIALIAANAAATGAWFLAALRAAEPATVLYAWSLTPATFIQGKASYTLLTHMFLHAGFLHLTVNMFFLWIFGDNVEESLGRWRYGALYLAAGVAAALAHTVVHFDSTVPMVGASGAVAGLMGAYFLLYPKARMRLFLFTRVIEAPMTLYLGGWLMLQLLYAALSGINMGVAFLAHASGFAVGAVWGWTEARSR